MYRISIHKALAGLDKIPGLQSGCRSRFQSTRPSRASTARRRKAAMRDTIFQSTRPSRASTTMSLNPNIQIGFQSTRPSRASTCEAERAEGFHRFQSTRPSRASTDNGDELEEFTEISIHKALAGLDFDLLNKIRELRISIHKALAGLDVRRYW